MQCDVVLLGYEDVLALPLDVVLQRYELVQLAVQRYALARLLELLDVEFQLALLQYVVAQIVKPLGVEPQLVAVQSVAVPLA